MPIQTPGDTSIGVRGGATGYTGNSAQASGIVPANDPAANAMFGDPSQWAAEDQAIQANNQSLTPTQMAAQTEATDNQANSIDNPDEWYDNLAREIALTGSIAGVGLLTGGVLAPELAAAAGVPGAVAGGAGVAGSVGTGLGAVGAAGAAGAAGGAFDAGLTGQPIGTGALLGGVGAGVGQALQPVSGALSNTTGLNSTLSNGIVKGAAGAGIGALGADLTGGSAANGALVGGIGGVANGLVGGSTGSNVLGGVSGTIASDLAGKYLTSPSTSPTVGAAASPSTASPLGALPTDMNTTGNIGSYSGYGYQPREQIQNPVSDYATYGQGPEASFFQNAGAPVQPATSTSSNTQPLPVGQPPAVMNTQPVPISIPTLRQ